MILSLLGLLIVEVVIIIVAGIRFLVKGYRFLRRGVKFKQQKLSTMGQLAGFTGLFLVVGLPRILGVRGDDSEHALLIYLLSTSIGTWLIIIGTQLGLAAYKSADETPKWMKWLLNI
jgi:hypothetical protein